MMLLGRLVKPVFVACAYVVQFDSNFFLVFRDN